MGAGEDVDGIDLDELEASDHALHVVAGGFAGAGHAKALRCEGDAACVLPGNRVHGWQSTGRREQVPDTRFKLTALISVLLFSFGAY